MLESLRNSLFFSLCCYTSVVLVSGGTASQWWAPAAVKENTGHALTQSSVTTVNSLTNTLGPRASVLYWESVPYWGVCRMHIVIMFGTDSSVHYKESVLFWGRPLFGDQKIETLDTKKACAFAFTVKVLLLTDALNKEQNHWLWRVIYKRAQVLHSHDGCVCVRVCVCVCACVTCDLLVGDGTGVRGENPPLLSGPLGWRITLLQTINTYKKVQVNQAYKYMQCMYTHFITNCK